MTFKFEQEPCALCNGTKRVEVIPHGYGANDSQEDECPWCLRRKMTQEYEHRESELSKEVRLAALHELSVFIESNYNLKAYYHIDRAHRILATNETIE